MDWMSNEYDIAGTVRTTDASQVRTEVKRIFNDLYPDASTRVLDTAFRDAVSLYEGRTPGFHACDTPYHDIQHVLEVTLAMARLMEGYDRSRLVAGPIGERQFRLGVVTALFHDVGYLRSHLDTPKAGNGAVYTRIHVSRGARFLRSYLPGLGMMDMAEIARELIHYTGYEKPLGSLWVPGPVYRLLGRLLGTADLLAQMADRCYLEKCRERLYPEFVAGGLTMRPGSEGVDEVVFGSGEDLVRKTPQFFASTLRRLDQDLGRSYQYMKLHFGGRDLYFAQMQRNIQFAAALSSDPDLPGLRRKPPVTLPIEVEASACLAGA
jgi:hypothetical protein